MFFNTPQEQRAKIEALPKGRYRVLISGSEGKASASGGRYLSLIFDIIEGDFKGRKIWHNFNMQNANAEAVRIGKSDLKALLDAIGHVEPIEYENEFHKLIQDKVLVVEVKHEKDKRDGEIKSRVKDFISDATDWGASPAGDVGVATLDDIPF